MSNRMEPFLHNKCQQGFSLIELMIVVAIIGLLAVIAVASYTDYTMRAAKRACMFEVRHYVTEVMIALNTPNEPVPAPASGGDSACASVSQAVNLETPVVGTLPEKYGGATVTCDIPTTSCSFTDE